MGLLDNLKGKLGPAKGKVSGLAQQHGGKIQHGIDKAAKAVDERTKGKYSKGIQSGSGKAKEAMDRLAHKDGPQGGTGGPGEPGGTGGTSGTGGTGGTTPPAGPPPTS
ncbi:antitoxin [Streptomyces sp. DH24]|uniref:antitoxin n=1 Tax=Streptomyces sp. DH24 TaxID=3040123 RepID=UPI002442EB2F|nr:antitoxin [Streptomyces sp. DH24]MDG9719812.1 antitoxin [Streptomyces sp. DH24]